MITDSDTVVTTHIMHDIFGTIFELIMELCLDLLGDELCRHLTMTKILYAETAMFSLDCFNLEVAILHPINIGCMQTPGTSFSNAFDDHT